MIREKMPVCIERKYLLFVSHDGLTSLIALLQLTWYYRLYRTNKAPHICIVNCLETISNEVKTLRTRPLSAA